MCARVLFILMATTAVVGCGPTAPTGGPQPTTAKDATAPNLDGVWVATKVAATGAGSLFGSKQMNDVCLSVKGDMLTVHQKGAPTAAYYLFEVDTSKTPNTIAFRKSDEKGTKGERENQRGIVCFEGDVVRMAVTTDPQVTLPPRLLNSDDEEKTQSRAELRAIQEKSEGIQGKINEIRKKAQDSGDEWVNGDVSPDVEERIARAKESVERLDMAHRRLKGKIDAGDFGPGREDAELAIEVSPTKKADIQKAVEKAKKAEEEAFKLNESGDPNAGLAAQKASAASAAADALVKEALSGVEDGVKAKKKLRLEAELEQTFGALIGARNRYEAIRQELTRANEKGVGLERHKAHDALLNEKRLLDERALIVERRTSWLTSLTQDAIVIHLARRKELPDWVK